MTQRDAICPVVCWQVFTSSSGWWWQQARLTVVANFHAYFIESRDGKQCAQSGTSQVSGLTATCHKYALSTIVSWTDVNKS